MGKDSRSRMRLLAIGLPVGAGLIAGLLTISNDRVAFVEGPLPVFLVASGVLVGILALAAVMILQGHVQVPIEPAAPLPSGVTERLQMLERLDEVVTARLDAVGAQLDRIGDPIADAVRAETRKLERFMVDVQGVAALHDVELDLEETDAAALVASALRSAARVAGDRVVKADLPTTDVAPFRADRKLLTLALVNLVVNAVKFSTPHTPIVVRVSDHDDRVLFEVVDDGPGVPPGEDVWVELVRGSNAGDTPGTGLGLPLVRLVAERHGGSAELSSGRSGTVARMVIPRR
jgi:two-component system, OmpR family, sensor kinase